MLVTLTVALLGYAALAAEGVHGGAASRRDAHIATWIARSMPAWAEWVARPFTWLGGVVGVKVVAVGIQLLVAGAKAGYERARPAEGGAIGLPSSFSFPSGHAATGIAVFGLLGLLTATFARTRAHRIAAVVTGVALATLIGASRVVLNVHYVTDVLAGACLGVAWLAACLLVACWIRARRRVPSAA